MKIGFGFKKGFSDKINRNNSKGMAMESIPTIRRYTSITIRHNCDLIKIKE
jgi:hypothetical protein